MNQSMTAEQLREIFLSTGTSDSTRIMAIFISFALVAVVLWLVRRQALQEEYTPIWIAVAASMVLITVSADLMQTITRAMGAWSSSSALFFLGELFLIAICLNYAVRLSRASMRMKNLAQELTLLRAQVERLESRVQ
jgi:hypothetical protein